MYINSLNSFIEFLGQRKHSLGDVLAYLALRSLAPWGCSSITIYNLNKYGELEQAAAFGNEVVGGEHSDVLHLAVVTGKALVASSDENSSSESFLALPIELNGRPCAVLGIHFSGQISPAREFLTFMQGISKLIALYFYQKDVSAFGSNDYARSRAIEAAQGKESDLTQRQLLILKMISEGMTNISIAEKLQYSESTIRQESIRIYAKLGCYGRHEAAKIYREREEKALLGFAPLTK